MKYEVVEIKGRRTVNNDKEKSTLFVHVIGHNIVIYYETVRLTAKSKYKHTIENNN